MERGTQTVNGFNITVVQKHYSGKISSGHIFEDKIRVIQKSNDYCLCLASLRFSSSSHPGGECTISFELPTRFNNADLARVRNIIRKISSNPEYLHSEEHYRTDRLDFNRFLYVIININGSLFEIPKNDPILKDLHKIMKCHEVERMASASYKNILSKNSDLDSKRRISVG